MSHHQPPTSNQLPNFWSSFLMWIVIILFAAAFILGTIAIITKQDIVISFISFILTLLGVLISIQQAMSKSFSQLRQTIKMGLVMIGIVLLITSLTVNAYLIIHSQTPASPTVLKTSTMTPQVPRTLTPTIASPVVPTLVQKNFQIQSQDTKSSTVSFPSSVTNSDFIVVAITQFKAAVSSVTDNQGDTYIQVTSTQHANSSSDYVELYYAKNVTGGTTRVTVTFSLSGGNVGVYEYSGINISNPLDQVISNAGSGDTPNGGTLNTTKDNELYFVIGVDDNGDNIAPLAGNGYTLEDHEDDSSHHERFYSEYRISPRGSYQTDFSISSKSSPTVWAIIGASFKPA